MFASLCLEKGSSRALPAFPSVAASIGRLDARTTQQVDRGLLGTDQLYLISAHETLIHRGCFTSNKAALKNQRRGHEIELAAMRNSTQKVVGESCARWGENFGSPPEDLRGRTAKKRLR